MKSHANRLIHETSPYLLQHAHNPVDWYPWGPEALTRAKEEDKPILVSIGYAACHWCHVMERESFEDEVAAQVMNEHFVNIKIDREERPDIDHIYMDAVQAMTGSGGWPLNVFLTPDRKPFYGGTYFPPVRAFNRSSWKEVLEAVSKSYKVKKVEIEEQAERLTEYLRNSSLLSSGKDNNTLLDEQLPGEIAKNILAAADKEWGGFGKAPKFPQTFSIQYLLRYYNHSKDEAALTQALLSLDKMIYGGIYDQLGGGFARYSTDEKWLVPHFEKMLYDNALLIGVLAEAYQLTGKELYAETIEQNMAFIEWEMMSEDGGFYSALDADSEGVEGKFYTWSKQEMEEILGKDSDLFCRYYDVSDAGNWEHTNILWVPVPSDEFAAANGLAIEHLKEIIYRGKALLMDRRDRRIRPALDDKLLLGWNALMNIACSKAYAATGVKRYRSLAERNMGFLEQSFKEATGGWLHTYKGGVAKYQAFLDDYAYLISAYVHLQEITGNAQYLSKAKATGEFVIANFEDSETGFFYFTCKQQEDVIVRKKEVYDGAIPSGNAIMAINLHYLGVVYDNPEWRKRGEELVNKLDKAIIQYPTSFGNWACLAQQLVHGTAEIAATGKNAITMLPELLSVYYPERVLQAAANEMIEFPLLRGKEYTEELLVYLCKNYTCNQPVISVDQLKLLLK